MQNKMQIILQKSRFIPLDTLENGIFLRLQKRIRFINTIKLFSYVIMGVLSGLSLFFYSSYLYTDIMNSSVYSYVQIFLQEDLNTLLLVPKEMVYILLEGLPMMSLTIIFGLLSIIMISVDGLMSTLPKNLYLNKK